MGPSRLVKSHSQLNVYRSGFHLSMEIFRLTQSFPVEEKYSLTDQVRRSSRSVCSNIAEAWRKRRYEAAFVAKLSDSEAEAAETQTWVEFTVECGYTERETGRELYRGYESIICTLVGMQNHASEWIFSR
jgi:four helix bundle protein